ncbi:MAG: hypothetical protein BAJATHORv1_140015 [Candidatus Thorarchaeota archaeon]|nr:MAG: hypothetical protein BAJATHORv1_140015 [Candidatus Thorarchaeota archaeon]
MKRRRQVRILEPLHDPARLVELHLGSGNPEILGDEARDRVLTQPAGEAGIVDHQPVRRTHLPAETIGLEGLDDEILLPGTALSIHRAQRDGELSLVTDTVEVEHETNPIPLYDGPDQIPIGRPGIGVGIGARPAASDDGVGTRQLGHQGGHPGGVLVLLLLLPIAHMGGAVGRGDEDGHAAGNVEELGLIPPCQPAIADVGLEADEALDQAGRVGNPSLHEGSIAHGGLGHKGISREARSPPVAI